MEVSGGFAGMNRSEVQQENGNGDIKQDGLGAKYRQIPVEGDEGVTYDGNLAVQRDLKVTQISVPKKRGLRKLLAYVGPGFLVAIAYIDPGNFESDLQAGALYKYELLWVLLLATIAGALIQSLASNLGVVTGKHLAEHCRAEYSSKTNYILWLLAELAVVASDIPEVIGTAYALNMLFRLPLWLGVILTGFSTLIFLALQQYGVRKLELFISFLVLTIASCFFVEIKYAKPPSTEVIKGLFIPRLGGYGATGIAISLLGAMVMPHNLYLHSALVLTRQTPRTTQGIKDGCRYNIIECGLALLLSFAINVAVVSVSGAVCSGANLSVEDRENCNNLDLNRAPFLLKVWNSVQASNIPTSHSIYNADQAGTSVYHTVREGQTLTSIARQYDTPIQKIAVVNNIDNIDVLQAGQLLVVPVHPKVVQRVPSRTMGSDEIAPKDQNMMPVLTTPARLSTPAMPFSSNLQLVKATASLLVFAPVLAFCIRCWVDSIQLRTNKGGLKQHTQEENWTTQHEPKLLRWQGILDGDRDGEVLDNFPGQGHNRTDSQENQSQDAYEEIRQSYVELEPAYLKFLAESGLSKSGYWRGGVPSALDENVR